jgi:hypothetical protein
MSEKIRSSSSEDMKCNLTKSTLNRIIIYTYTPPDTSLFCEQQNHMYTKIKCDCKGGGHSFHRIERSNFVIFVCYHCDLIFKYIVVGISNVCAEIKQHHVQRYVYHVNTLPSLMEFAEQNNNVYSKLLCDNHDRHNRHIFVPFKYNNNMVTYVCRYCNIVFKYVSK